MDLTSNHLAQNSVPNHLSPVYVIHHQHWAQKGSKLVVDIFGFGSSLCIRYIIKWTRIICLYPSTVATFCAIRILFSAGGGRLFLFRVLLREWWAMTGNVKNCQNKLPSPSVCSFPVVGCWLPWIAIHLPLNGRWSGVVCRWRAVSLNDNKLLFYWLYFHKQILATTRGQITCSESQSQAERGPMRDHHHHHPFTIRWRRWRRRWRRRKNNGPSPLRIAGGFCNNLSSETEQRVIFLPLCIVLQHVLHLLRLLLLCLMYTNNPFSIQLLCVFWGAAGAVRGGNS